MVVSLERNDATAIAPALTDRLLKLAEEIL